MALVELGRYSPPEAHMVIGLLEAEGIMAFAFDAGSSVVEGSLAMLIPVRVMVDDEDLHLARAVMPTA
ncbi:putative signal transducing protein [Sphingomonas sp. LT1P40]|uniref:putative signal transducing protein n=1 Tax=Alteristakelama amylovorans TaxID=3096166 RepID=UPI002FCA6A52